MHRSFAVYALFLTCAGCVSGDFPATDPAPGPWAGESLWPGRAQRQRLRYAGRLERSGKVVAFTLLVLVGYPEDPFRAIGLTELGGPWFEVSVDEDGVVVHDVREPLERELLEAHLARDLFGAFRHLASEDVTACTLDGAPAGRFRGVAEDVLTSFADDEARVWLGDGDVRSRAWLRGRSWPPENVQVEGPAHRLVLDLAPLR